MENYKSYILYSALGTLGTTLNFFERVVADATSFIGAATLIGTCWLFRRNQSPDSQKKRSHITDPDLKLLLELMDQLAEEYAPVVKYYREMYRKLKTQSIFSVNQSAKANLAKQLTKQC